MLLRRGCSDAVIVQHCEFFTGYDKLIIHSFYHKILHVVPGRDTQDQLELLGIIVMNHDRTMVLLLTRLRLGTVRFTAVPGGAWGSSCCGRGAGGARNRGKSTIVALSTIF